jgi:hypothetical protein
MAAGGIRPAQVRRPTLAGRRFQDEGT